MCRPASPACHCPCLTPTTEAQEFKKQFEAAAEANSALINASAVPTVGGDGSAEAADQLADELGKAAVKDDAAAPAAAAADPKAEAAAAPA